ncbi:MAG: 2-amino-4-hydroxy-6-hydroxymethyldihydropteridine diphosphokinase [Candidatus Nanopelagicales bacterium]
MSYFDADDHIYDRELISFSIGSNLGDRVGYLQLAVDRLDESDLLEVQAVSAIYETDPVGGPEQDDFFNAVVIAKSERHLTIAEFLDLIRSIEQDANRVRMVRNGPRTLDVDVLAVGDRVSDDPDLLLPHPRALERAFVIVPWAEVSPKLRVSGGDLMNDPKPLAEQAADLSDEDQASVRKREDLGPLRFTN